MASSPIHRATPELPRYRSSYSVPVHSRDLSRSETPGSSRASKSFFNRQVTPSTSRSHSVARDDVAAIANHRQRVASVGKLFETWDEVARKTKEVWLEDDDEVDLETETVHKSDGSIAPWCPDEGQSPPDWARDEDGSPEAGPSRRRIIKQRSEDTDDDTNSDSDSHDDIEDTEEVESEDEEDELGSWRDQEEEMKAQLDHRKAALLLASLRSRPEQTSDEEMEEFLRDEEEARARRMSARAEGRDSRCHTDKLSESEESEETGESRVESPPLEYRSPSSFTTVVAGKIEDLFSDDESSEDELALPSSDVEHGNDQSSSEGSASEDELQSQSASILARARQVRSTWLEGSSSSRALTFPLSPDSSPEPEIIAENVRPVSPVIPGSLRAKQRIIKTSNAQPQVATVPSPAHKAARPGTEIKIGDEPQDQPIKRRSKDEKGKSRMAGERPTDPPVLDDVFGPAENIDTNNLDRRRYRRSRYRQKASLAYKACRYCRYAEPARAKLAEYCRGANHSKLCTFEYPPKTLVRDMDVVTDADKTTSTFRKRFWKDKEPDRVPVEAPIEATSPATGRRSGLTSIGLERWRYFENLVKRPDKQTDRSCPYCRASDDIVRVENSAYCRGRIESKDCTFDGHKGNLRKSSKKRQPKEEVTPSEPINPPTERITTPKNPIERTLTPKTPTITTAGPDLTVDETKLDIKLYYTSLIQSQLQNGYRFCPDCARSDNQERRRLSFWCRGRISFKACGYWDGDNTGHRQPGRHSTSGSKVKTVRNVETPKPEPPREINDSTPASNQGKHGARESAEAIPPRKRGRPRKSDIPISTTTEPGAPANKVQTTPISNSMRLDTGQISQTEPVKRKPGRPKKTSLLESEQVPVPASEPVKRKPGRPRKISLVDPQQASTPQTEPIKLKIKFSRPMTVPPEETSTSLAGEKKRKRGPRPSAPDISSRHDDKIIKRKPDRPETHHTDADAGDDADIDMVQDQELNIPARTPKVWSGWDSRRSMDEPRPIPRRRRSRTFDVVVPASRSTTPVPSPTLGNAVGRDRHFHGPVLPVSAMRNTHMTEHSLPHRLDSNVGVRELDSLPPSSPPTSLSPSPSPEPIRYMPSGHRSSPLASMSQHNRSSSAFSETPMPIRGILRLSSEVGDALRKRPRVSFSVVRPPSPDEESEESDYDSDSSDDILLLVDPSSASRRSAPPSSRRNGSSSPFGAEARFAESPQAGRLSSSTLAAYARPLDRPPPVFGNASDSKNTPPQAPRTLAGHRSSLSTPPTTSRSVPPSSGRGLMQPPPVPEYRLAPVPQSEPRPRVAIQRARTAVPASRSRSSPMSSKSAYQQPANKLVAENIVIRRLINDVR